MALLSASATVLIMVDDEDKSIVYSDDCWEVYSDTYYTDGQLEYAANTSCSFSYTFDGRQVSVTGNTEQGSSMQYNSQVDNGTTQAQIVTYVDDTDFYGPWYTSPVLEDGRHKILLSNITYGAVDYITYVAGESTATEGLLVRVDSESSELVYAGKGWARSDEQFYHDSTASSLVTKNVTTYQTSSVGDSFTFQFYGSSISVYGVFHWENVGAVQSTYTVDGGTPTLWQVSSNGTDTVHGYKDQINYLFFSSNLTAANHTLEVNVTDITNSQTYILDYITYNAAFSSIAAKPNFTTTAATSTTSSTSSSSTSSSTSAAAHSSSPNLSPGAIAGIVVGSVAFLFIIVALGLFLIRRHRRREHWNAEPAPVVPLPFTPMRAASSDPATAMTITSLPHPSSGNLSDTNKSGLWAAMPSSALTQESVPTHANLRRRLVDLQRDMARMEASVSSSVSGSSQHAVDQARIAQLQQEVEMLRAENARLYGDHDLPPAYD
ncbi:hypothetical protein FISHEDRAFT_77949 [Fistulina hepatica ATCC 64428]|nr:hypothetical protein FISHEDRAFT_77949 [Fistulina hepatica ATCC 64428]